MGIISFNPDNSPRRRGYYPHFTNWQTEAQREPLTCLQVTPTPSCCPRRTLGPQRRSRAEIKGNANQPAWVHLYQGPPAGTLWASVSILCPRSGREHWPHTSRTLLLSPNSLPGWTVQGAGFLPSPPEISWKGQPEVTPPLPDPKSQVVPLGTRLRGTS